MNVSFIHILLPQFLTDSLINILLFELGHICIHLGALSACFSDDFWHPWVGEAFRCIGHYGWLTDISVGHPNILRQLIRIPGKLVRGSRPKVEDIT